MNHWKPKRIINALFALIFYAALIVLKKEFDYRKTPVKM